MGIIDRHLQLHPVNLNRLICCSSAIIFNAKTRIGLKETQSPERFRFS